MESPMASTRASRVLNATPRIPACVACQKQKVKCAVEDGKPPCRRCKNRRVECVFKQSSYGTPAAITEATKSDEYYHDLMMLYTAVNELRAKSAQPPLPPLQSVPTHLQTEHPAVSAIAAENPDETQNPFLQAELENADADTEMLVERSRRPSDTGDLSQAPMTNLYQITRLRSLRSQRLTASSRQGSDSSRLPDDLISRGLLGLADAERLVAAYLERTDHYLYGLVSKYHDLESVRRGSSLLLVAICTVSASQEPTGSKLYRICHAEFRRLVTNFVFTSRVDLEDFRGLCVACFWLSDISWAISGLAIRRAVEFALQDSLQVVINSADRSRHEGSSAEALNDALERLRLWYMFYICDQHLSVLYGRQPVIQDQDSIREWESYLAVVPESVPDRRIASQVALLRILNVVSRLFGLDLERRLPVIFKTQLGSFIEELDQWVTDWLARYERAPQIGDYPKKAVALHFHFAKLFVCSHVFRGLSADVTVDPIPPPFLTAGHMAVESAKSIIQSVVEDNDLVSSFAGLPHYFHTMVAFACSFLLKTATKYRHHVRIDTQAVFAMIGQVVALCKNTPCAQFHLVRWIGEGLQVLLSSCISAMQRSEGEWNHTNVPRSETEQFLPTPGTTSHHVDAENGIGVRENAGGLWDEAFQNAIIYSGDNSFYDGSGDFLGLQSDSSMTHVNLDHFGLGLGLL